MRRILFLLILTIIIVAVGSLNTWPLLSQDAKAQQIIHILRTIPRNFYVVATEESIRVASHDSSNAWLGTRRGQATISARVHYGFDFQKVRPEHIGVEGSNVTITLPRLEVFDASIDTGSLTVITKRSTIHVIRDAVRGRSMENELLRQIGRELESVDAHSLRNQRAAIIERLNHDSVAIFKGTGLNVRFE